MIETGQMTVDITSQQIDGNRNIPSQLILHNLDNSATLFIGNGNVATDNGLGIGPNETYTIDVPANDSLFVISTKAGHLVSYMRVSH